MFYNNHHKDFVRSSHIPLLFLSISISIFSCSKGDITDNNPATIPSIHLGMGNPSSAVNDISMPSNYLMIKPEYVLSYNKDRGTPNWVSWRLDLSWLGTASRQDDFRADTSLPMGWYRVQPTDYTGSGFDRGHNVPSADRTKTDEDNSATFLMTNFIPQAPNHNRQVWENLERYCRTLVDQGKELYIIMGSYGIGGTGSGGTKSTIADGKITVPARIWKVVVVLQGGSNGAASVSTTTRVIAVDTPNSDSVSASWGTYRTTVDKIEENTGYNLLSLVAEGVQENIEKVVDNGPTQ